jgi:hypothetical protein
VRRRSRRRLGGRLAVAAGLALMAVLVAVVVVRVTILSTAIDSALATGGFTDARYRIASVGVTATRIVDIRLGAELAARELTLRYRPLQLLGLNIDEIAVSGLHVDLAGDESGPLARLLAGDDTGNDETQPPRLPRLRIADGTARLPGDVNLALGGIAVDSTADGTGYSFVASKLAVERGTLRVALDGLTATADMAGGLARPVVRFALASLAHDVDEPLVAPVALAGQIERQGEVWNLAATATAAHATKIELQGSYGLTDGTIRGRITLPSIHFTPDGLQPGDMVPALGAMQSVTGAVAGHLAVRWQSGHPIVPDGVLRIDDLSFEAGGLPVEMLTARAALAGEGAPAEPVLRIEEAHLTLAGGRIATSGTVFKPLAEHNRLILQIRDLDLSLLLAALDMEGVSGEGKFAGALPFLVASDDVAIESGKLEAQGPGVLRMASPETASALAQGGKDTNLLLQALADFHYERLALTFDKPLSGESSLTLNMLGHNPAVLDGHPFQINVTVTTNLDKILGIITQGGRLSQDLIRAMVGARR